ncbi:MAG: hypothetical protein HY815_28595 [Candidatus Riflebacteria bacterium]|nr:hypothetical protein [Candidatus Riflebacteria bacterium]
MGRLSGELQRMGKHIRQRRDSRANAVKSLRSEASTMISAARSTRQRLAAAQRETLSADRAGRSRAMAEFLSAAREGRSKNAVLRALESRKTLAQRRRSVQKTLENARRFTRDVSRRLAEEFDTQKENLVGFVGGLKAAIDQAMKTHHQVRAAFVADYQTGARLMREALDGKPTEPRR